MPERSPELEPALFRLQLARSELSTFSRFVIELGKLWTKAVADEKHDLPRPLMSRLVRSSRGTTRLNQAAVDTWDEVFGVPEAQPDAQEYSHEALGQLSPAARAAAISSSLIPRPRTP